MSTTNQGMSFVEIEQIVAERVANAIETIAIYETKTRMARESMSQTKQQKEKVVENASNKRNTVSWVFFLGRSILNGIYKKVIRNLFSPHTVSTIKLPILKKGEYDIWAMKMEHYLAHTDYPIWEVIQRGNGPVSPLKMQIRSFLESLSLMLKALLLTTASSSALQNVAFDLKDTTVLRYKTVQFARRVQSKGNQDSRDEMLGTLGNKIKTVGRRLGNRQNLKLCEETHESMPEPVVNEPKVVSQPKVWSDAPIIEEYESDSDDEHVSVPSKEQETPSCAFINNVKHVKTPRQTVKEQNTCSKCPKPDKKDFSGLMSKKLGLGYGFTKKACFVCGSFSHLIRDCDFPEKRMAKQAELNKRISKGTGQRQNRPVWNNVQRVNHQNQFVPAAVLTRTGRIQVNTARTSGTNTVNTARHNFNSQAVPTNAAKKVNTVKPIDYPQRALQNKGIVDSGCSRHMTGNKAYLAEYQDFNGGPLLLEICDKKNKVLFTDTECLVLSHEFKLPDKNQVLLRVPRQNNMYSFNLENIVPFGGLACLIAKATVDESNKWHRRLGHVNFKNVNKLVKGNLVRVKSSETKNEGEKPTKNTDLMTNEKPVDKEILRIFAVFQAELLELANIAHCHLEDSYDNPNDDIFTNASYDNEGAVADFTNLETIVNVSPIPTSRIHSIHPSNQILRYPKSAVQIRSKVHKSFGAYAFVNIQKQRRNNHKDFQHCLFTCFLYQIEPKKISDALEDESWVDAMQEELLQFKIQKVWILEDLPYGKKAIGTKWVYRNKKDEKGVVVRNKARLVAQGHSKEEGIDYDDVYVSQPLGFVDPKYLKKVYKVVKALYGLHQAPRAWYATLSTFLLKSGYKRGTIDKTLFIKKDKNDIMLVQVYVDDIIFGSTKRSWCDEFEALMKSRFQISSMGELTFFLGLQVKQKEDGIFISQDKYIAEILKFDFASVKTISTPIETQKPLVKDEEVSDVDVHLYRSMIGSLMYLTASRPDIMFAVCACSRVSLFDLEAYSDSDYARANLNRKSTIGGCQFLGRRLISWQCKKQTIVATSTTAAEYVAAANYCGQVLWIQNQMLDYGFNFMNTKIYIDNYSTICIVKNPVFHSKTKHIAIRHHFIRDTYEKKRIQVLKIHTDDNVADLLTKAFDVSRFKFLVVTIGMINP
ncbi:putative ribonuclease H-like domain-containing protein [Tanacetum coccineum]